MDRVWLECAACRSRFTLGPMYFGCPNCLESGHKSPLEVQYATESLAWPQPHSEAEGIWKWQSLLPQLNPRNRITLGEGNTPLIPLRVTAHGANLWLKNETKNPTWSWKDRPNCISVSMAKEFGYEGVAAISTGNHGNAMAAYAAAGGLSGVVLCHEDAPAVQMALMQYFGASVIRGGRQAELLRQLIERHRCFPCSTLCPREGISNPFGVEGFKTIAFELFEQMRSALPDCVFVPVGSGDGIYGIWKGFRELRAIGASDRVPRMIACQAAGADSTFRAFHLGSHRTKTLAAVSTMALSVGEPVTGDHALRAVYESEGAVLTATDDQIIEAAQLIAREGIAVELASALPLACVLQPSAKSLGCHSGVVIGSGAAVKWPDILLRTSRTPAPLAPGFDRLEELDLAPAFDGQPA